MGASFTNVQVFRNKTTTAESVVEAVVRDAARRNMAPASDGDDAARSVIVIPGERWISILDEATEDQSMAELERLARSASRSCDTRAVTVLVHDSGFVDLRLFARGKRVDQYNSQPHYFEDRAPTDRERRTFGGQPPRWAPLLVGTTAQLQKVWAWETQPLLAEETARKTGRLLGCSPRWIACGFRSVDESALPRFARRLAFRWRTQPSWERSASGPPRLILADGGLAFLGDDDPSAPRHVGDATRAMLVCRNAGGEGTGLTVVFSGDVLEHELLTIQDVSIQVGNGASRASVRRPRKATGPDGQRVLVADGKELWIGPGIAGEPPRSGANARAWEAFEQSAIIVSFVARMARIGDGKLGVGVAPIEDAKGAIGIVVPLVIAPAARRRRGARRST